MPPPSGVSRTRPIETFAKAVGQCSTEAAAYGKCVFSDFNNVYKDKCVDDFMRLKECVSAKMKKK